MPHLAPAREDREVGAGHAVVAEELLGQRLVTREEQAARVASRVGHLQQLEVGHDVVVEGDDVVETLEQVEGDVGLEVEEGVADPAQLVSHPQDLHLVAQRFQGAHDVVFGLPGLARQLFGIGGGGRHEVGMDKGEDAELLGRRLLLPAHRGTRWRPVASSSIV